MNKLFLCLLALLLVGCSRSEKEWTGICNGIPCDVKFSTGFVLISTKESKYCSEKCAAKEKITGYDWDCLEPCLNDSIKNYE